jgi:hypothetical protein
MISPTYLPLHGYSSFSFQGQVPSFSQHFHLFCSLIDAPVFSILNRGATAFELGKPPTNLCFSSSLYFWNYFKHSESLPFSRHDIIIIKKHTLVLKRTLFNHSMSNSLIPSQSNSAASIYIQCCKFLLSAVVSDWGQFKNSLIALTEGCNITYYFHALDFLCEIDKAWWLSDLIWQFGTC